MVSLVYGDMIRVYKELYYNSALCISTNGFIKSNNEGVMGRGIAKQYKDCCSTAQKTLGENLIKYNNNMSILNFEPSTKTIVLSFPVKPAFIDKYNKSLLVNHMQNKIKYGPMPGWACKADLNIIEKSLKQLITIIPILSNLYNINDYHLPKLGCGAGELNWDVDVYPLIKQYLEPRPEKFYFWDFKNKDKV